MNAIFLGGDQRQKFACEYLNLHKISSEYYEDFDLDEEMKSKIKSSTILALPIPILNDKKMLNKFGTNIINPYEIFELLNENHIVFAGKFSDSLKSYLINNKIQYLDYFDIESFQIKNALLSAEGAIYYAKEKLNKSISNSTIGILGFGRIGKILVYLLHSQGAKITVYARKESDFAWCKLIGLDAVKIKIWGNTSKLEFNHKEYDLIFNTIPYKIMDENFAEKYSDSALIIDLASYPFGIDEKLIDKYKLKYYRELGIPGRYAPQSAGEIIGETILNYLCIKEE